MYLTLTDDTTTLHLTWNQHVGTSYLLRAWPLAIAALNPNELGYPYSDVDEEIILDILGDSVSATVKALRDLVTLLDQADRWWRGDQVDPVYLDYRADESSTIWRVRVLGRTGRDSLSGVRVAPAYQKDSQIWALREIRLSLRREGIWRTKEPIETLTSTTLAPPRAYTTGITSALIDQDMYPMVLRILGITTSSDGAYVLAGTLGSFCAIVPVRTPGSNGIVILNAEDFTAQTFGSATRATIAIPSQFLARGDQALRLTASDGQTANLYYNLNTADFETARRIQVWFNYSSSTIDAEWRIVSIRARRYQKIETEILVTPVRIVGQSVTRQWLQTPPMDIPAGADQILIQIVCDDDAATGAAGFLIDSIIVVNLTDPDATVVQLDEDFDFGSVDWTFGATSYVPEINPISADQQYVAATIDGTERVPLSYRGNPFAMTRFSTRITLGFWGMYSDQWGIPLEPDSGTARTIQLALDIYGGKRLPQADIPDAGPETIG